MYLLLIPFLFLLLLLLLWHLQMHDGGIRVRHQEACVRSNRQEGGGQIPRRQAWNDVDNMEGVIYTYRGEGIYLG